MPTSPSVVWFSTRVSKRAIFLFLPNPVKKAFDLVERLDPSMMNSSVSGKLHFLAMSLMASLSSPSGMGSNLLNRGRKTDGAM